MLGHNPRRKSLPSLPDPHGIFVLLLTPLALYLFTRDRLPLEASGLAILVILVLSFELVPYEVNGVRLAPTAFLTGFGNEALITICALMIMGKGLEATGALQPIAVSLAKAWTARPKLAGLGTLVMAAILSAFVNNTPIVVMLLPMLIGVAVRNKFAPSSILMPVGFATLIGGMATTIGTLHESTRRRHRRGPGARTFQYVRFHITGAVRRRYRRTVFMARRTPVASRTEAAPGRPFTTGLQRNVSYSMMPARYAD